MNNQPPEDNKKGYTVKIKRTGRSKLRLPIYCPNPECRIITSSPMDDNSLRTWGLCLHCYVTLIENREKPLIDVEYYRNKAKEQDY